MVKLMKVMKSSMKAMKSTQDKKTSTPTPPKMKAAAAKATKAVAAAKLAAEKAAEEAQKSQPSDGLVVRYVKHNREEKSLKKAVAEKSPKKAGVEKTPKKTGVEKTPKKRAQEVAAAVAEVPKAVAQAPKPEKPNLKKPTGGGYGVFVKEQRDEISKSVGTSVPAVAKKAGELYKALTDEERKVYHEKYAEHYETYKAAVAEYEKACKLAGHIAETTPAKKRKPDGFVTPVKKPRAVKISAESVGPLDPDSLHEAKGLGYEEAFRRLAACKVLIEKNIPHDKIVRALRASGGALGKPNGTVEKKAFAALSRTFYQPSRTN